MRELLKRLVLMSALLLFSTLTNAQIRYAPLATEKFTMSVKNVSKTSPNTLEFDVYLLDTDASQPFELGSCQLGIVFNSLIYNGGTISVTTNNTGTGLNAAQQFTSVPTLTSSITGYPNQTLISLAGRPVPGKGNGTIISTVDSGTLLTHFSLTSSVSFTSSFTPNITFNSNDILLPLYATRVSSYIGNANIPLVVNPATNAIIDSNPVLTDDFLLSVQNMKKTALNKLEFDVFLLDTDASHSFELGNTQLGFLLNSNIFTGGTISVAISNTNTGLNDTQKFTSIPSVTSSLSENPGQTLIRLAGRSSPGSGNGTIISTTGNGTLLTHYTITSSVNFTPNTTPGITFTSSGVYPPLYATRVSEYINNVNTPLTVIPGVNAIVNDNIVLTDDFIISIQNLIQTAPTKLEFDVNLFDSDTSLPFELGSVQLGFLFNSNIYTGGTISVAISNTGSGLNTAQQFTSTTSTTGTISGYANQTLIRLAGRTPPGDGNGTIIATNNPETLLTHFTITSSVNFTANSTPDFKFISSRANIPLYATRVSEYMSHINTPLIVMPDTNAIVIGNPVLNPSLTAPESFDVSEGGTYCPESAGFPVGLSGSELDVIYTLYKDGVIQAPTVTGTGAPISFGNQLFGTYTVSATNESETIFMNGSAIIEENTAAASSISINSDFNDICPGTSVTFMASVVNGGTNPFYQWQVNGVNVGANNAVYIYSPAGNDMVTCFLTSNATCASTFPIISNAITMNIAPASEGGTVTGNSTIVYGNSTGPMTLSGYTGTIVKWQKSDGISTWVDILETTDAYSEIPSSVGTWLYRAQIKSGTCPATSSAILSIIVSPKILIIQGTFTAESKEYDGLTTATIGTYELTLDALTGSDEVFLSAVAVFDNKSVGIDKIVTLAGSSLTGANAGNYILSFAGAPASTADITAIPVILSAFADINKTFGDPDFVLIKPTSISTGLFSYTSSNTSVATISGNTVTIIGAGISTITALQEASEGYATASITAKLTVAKANQVITLNPLPTVLPLNQFIGFPLPISASSSSGLPVIITLGPGSPATLSLINGIYYLTTTLAVGNVVIIVDQAGNENYNPGQIIQSFDVTKGNQTITFDALSPLTFAPGLSIDLTASASSGLPIIFTVISGPGTLTDGDHLSITGAGIVVIQASQDGDIIWNAATNVIRNLVVDKAVPNIINFPDIIKTYGDPPFSLNATSVSSGTFTYTSSDITIAAISGNIATITGAGISTITVVQDASSNYHYAAAQATLTVLKAEQTITFDSLTDKSLGDPEFDLMANSTSLLEISYISSNPAVATVNGNTITITGIGDVTITASQSGNANYKAAQDVSRSFTVTSCRNPLNGGSVSGDRTNCASFDPEPITSTTTASGQYGTLEYKWQQSNVSGVAGFEDIIASNSESYNPGTITQTTWYKRIARVICTSDWSEAAESNVVKITVNPTTVRGTITGPNTITYGNSTDAMIISGYTGTVVKWQEIKVTEVIPEIWTDIINTSSTYSHTPTSAGIWKYRAQVRSGNCLAVFSSPLIVTILPKTLTIGGTFTAENKEYDGNDTAKIATNDLTLITLVGNDEVTLNANAAFNDKSVGNDKPVSLIGSSLSGAEAGNYILSFTDAPVAKANITAKAVILGAFPDIYKIYGDPDFVLIKPTSNSPGLFQFTSSNPAVATISGNVVTIIGAGIATITAFQEASDGYTSSSVSAMLTVAKANQILTLNPLPTPLPLNQFIGTPLPISAVSSAGLEVSITLGSESPATLSFADGKYNLTTTYSAGIVVINLDQPGNANYNSAHLSLSFDVTKGNQTITFDELASLTYSPDLNIRLTATASSGLPVVFKVISGPGSLTEGNHLNITGAGVIVIQASQAGNSSWNPATAVIRNLVINKAAPTIIDFSDIIKTYGDTPFTLNATSNSPGTFTYTSSNPKVATISGNTVTILRTGITTITATLDATENYFSVPVQITLFVIKADQTITFEPLINKNLGDPTFELEASSTSLLEVTFVSSNTSVATVKGRTVTIVGIGEVTIIASQPGNINYKAAPDVDQTFRVNSFEYPVSSVQNLMQTAPNILEFDVYLLDLSESRSFELAITQLGFLFNSLIYKGGNISVAISNTNSGLNEEQHFTATPTLASSIPGYPNQTLIRLAGRTPPGTGNGTIIETSAPGTLLTHFVLTSSVSFTTNSTPNLIYMSNEVYNPLYATRVSEYIRDIDTPMKVIPGVNAIVNGNPFLNPSSTLVTAFAVTGGGTYCQENIGLPVGVQSSEYGISYTLYKNGIAQLPSVAGTGSAISFGNQLSGIYTIRGTKGNITGSMTGIATIEKNLSVTALITLTSNANYVCPGTPVTFTATSINGGVPIYQWFKNGLPVGSNFATYTYEPLNGDEIHVLMTSSLDCVSANQVSSSPMKMVVEMLPAPSVGKIIQPTCSTATGSVELFYLPLGAWTITISPGGQMISGTGTSAIITGLISGTTSTSYTATVTNMTGCVSAASTNFVISSQPGTLLPAVVTRNQDILISSSEIGNQWYIDGVAIPGATGKEYTAVTYGTYYTILTIDGCSSATSNWVIAPIIDEELLDPTLSVYPNPSSGIFNLQIETSRKEVLDIKIYNMLSVIILQRYGIFVNGIYKTKVDITGLPEGVYIIALTNKSTKIVKKIILRPVTAQEYY